MQVKGGTPSGQGQGQPASAPKKTEKVGEKRTHEQATNKVESSSLTSLSDDGADAKRARSGSESSEL